MPKTTHTQATQPARHHINVLGQMLKFIPRDIIHKSAKETGVDLKARTYSVLSHLGTMIFAQLAHALSLNDVCDWLRLRSRAIAAFGLTPPSRNNLSNSNKVRDARFAELVFWRSLATSSTVIAALDGSAPAAVPGTRCCIGSKCASTPWIDVATLHPSGSLRLSISLRSVPP